MCKKASEENGELVDVVALMRKVRHLKHAAEFFSLGEGDPSLMLPLVDKYLTELGNDVETPYTREDVCRILGIDDQQLAELALNQNTMQCE